MFLQFRNSCADKKPPRSARVSDLAETLDRRSRGLGGEVGRPAPNARNGFTLMEMMIVIAIMLLLVIATLPRIKQGLEDSKVRESSRQLNSYIALAKARAASTGRACGVFMQVEPLPTGGRMCTDVYLAETPPAYAGDVLEDQAFIVNSITSPGEFDPNGANYDENYRGTWWQVNFQNGFSLPTLLANDFPPYPKFKVQFEYKGPYFNGILYNGNFYVIGPRDPLTNNRILPPGAGNPNAGHKYQVFRRPRRIGAPLPLPRGTCIDLGYSGIGSNGTIFSAASQSIYVMCNPTGHVEMVAIDGTVFDAIGTLHFLIGRPEKVINYSTNLPLDRNSNIVDQNALWVSITRLTGSIVTTENAYTEDLNLLAEDNPTFNPGNQQFSDYILAARKFARTQDVKGGQ